jgi:signal transduction histidine kinase/DNA-binding response OmpR family regulator
MPQQFEQGVREPGGRESAWQVHYVPDTDGDTVKGFFVLAHEVTELKKARDVALAASQAKTRFLSNMSHEIRTPMNAVLGMLTLLRATPLTERQADYAGKAEGAARALLSLLNDVLDFSKIEAGKMQLDCRPFSLDTTFAELSVILSANVGSKEIEVLYDLDPAVPERLVGDDMRLRQILINLGGNAVKFTSQGEVVVRTRLLAREAGRATVEFSVQDSGIGMTPEQQQRLFTDYAQATGQTARQFGGTGLGLGICRRLTEMMGSQIRLESTPGVGSRFWFALTLPVADDAPAPAAATLGERVLIVDDNELARSTLARLAASLGWQVDTARSGEDAIAAMAEASAGGSRYDAVFMDWRMPGLDGWEASLRLRALPAQAPTPVLVMVTAHGREMLGQRPLQEQALLDGFLVKPVTAAMLREAVERAAGRPQGSGPDALGRQPLAGLRLLLAEDNPVNQQIARELLTAQGARIDVVGDGQQAVDRIAAGERYDAVLMDMLMPVLDGLAATVCIRQTLRQTALPIIAMTANAMDTDRAECLAAGMDDHVSKPIVLAEVVETLLRHVPGAAPAPASPAFAPQSVLVPRGPAGAVLDRDEALGRLGGDLGLYEQLLPMFRQNLAQSGRDLQAALARAARDDVARLVHTIKGMAANMGAVVLASAAQGAEQALRGGAAPDGAALRAVTQALEATLAALAAS